jgi:hypothetical protein
MPYSFMEPNSNIPMYTPTMDKTGPVPVKPAAPSMPIEELIQQRKAGQPAPQPTMSPMMLVPVPSAPAQGTTAPPAAAPPGAGGVAK